MNEKAFKSIIECIKSNNFEHTLLEHLPCRTSAESAATRAAAGFPQAIGAKALLCKMDRVLGSEFNVLVLPGTSKLVNSALKTGISGLRKMRFATPEELLSLCGVVPGCMPPFGNRLFPEIKNLFVDRTLLTHEWIGFNAAYLERSIVMRASDYIQIADVTSVLDFAEEITGIPDKNVILG